MPQAALFGDSGVFLLSESYPLALSSDSGGDGDPDKDS